MKMGERLLKLQEKASRQRTIRTKRRGKKDTLNPKDLTIQVRLSDGLHSKLKSKADGLGFTVSYLVRSLIEEEVGELALDTPSPSG